MDDTDILKRLRQIYAALGDTTGLDPQSVKPEIRQGPGFFSIWQDFSGGRTQEHHESDANHLLSAFMGLRDRAQQWLSAMGKDRQLVVDFMKATRSVALLHDLGIVEKHGTQDHTSYSGHKPVLTEVRRVLQMRGSAQMVILPSGEQRMIGNNSVLLTGEVVDANGTRLASFDQLLDEALPAWEAFLQGHGLAIP